MSRYYLVFIIFVYQSRIRIFIIFIGIFFFLLLGPSPSPHTRGPTTQRRGWLGPFLLSRAISPTALAFLLLMPNGQDSKQLPYVAVSSFPRVAPPQQTQFFPSCMVSANVPHLQGNPCTRACIVELPLLPTALEPHASFLLYSQPKPTTASDDRRFPARQINQFIFPMLGARLVTSTAVPSRFSTQTAFDPHLSPSWFASTPTHFFPMRANFAGEDPTHNLGP